MPLIERINNAPSLWLSHPLGPPNRATQAVYLTLGHLFAIGRYSQHCDRHILSITRHFVTDSSHPASAALAALRRQVRRDFPAVLALQTYTDPQHAGTSYRADGWVFVTNHNNHKRWLRTL